MLIHYMSKNKIKIKYNIRKETVFFKHKIYTMKTIYICFEVTINVWHTILLNAKPNYIINFIYSVSNMLQCLNLHPTHTTYRQTQTSPHTYRHTHTDTHTHTQTHKDIDTDTGRHVHKDIDTDTGTHDMYTCTHVHMHTCTHAHMHTGTPTDRQMETETDTEIERQIRRAGDV